MIVANKQRNARHGAFDARKMYKSTMKKWTEFRTAYEVARLGSVSAASRALGVHRATVNRHIDALEDELGSPIFLRNRKGYMLTELGEDLLKVAQKTEGLLEDLAGRARGRDGSITGEIKITSIPNFTNLLMNPIASFRKANPQCKVTIISSEDLQRLEYGDAHIAPRAGAKPAHPDYVVQSFGPVRLNLYAEKGYLSRNGGLDRLTDLSRHVFVLPALIDARLPIFAWLSENVPDLKVAVETTDAIAAREAVLAGLGLGILTEFDVVGGDDLTPVLPANTEWDIPLWLVSHVDLHRTEKVQEMLSHIKAIRN